ncbi:MAG: hypothetical protein KFW21_02945 [Spirochaetota bacterium]|nr:hypothetical protein [Spirochaetota bacterium]
MIISLICFIFLGIILLVYFHKKQKISIDPKYLIQIEAYLTQELNLDDSIKFIDCVRELNIHLVQLSQKQKISVPMIHLTHELLGLILQVPRIPEQNNDILAAIKQISTITQVANDLKLFFLKNISTFKKYI